MEPIEWSLADIIIIAVLSIINIALVWLARFLDKKEKLKCLDCGKEMTILSTEKRQGDNEPQHIFCPMCSELRKEYSKEERKWDIIVASKSFKDNLVLN